MWNWFKRVWFECCIFLNSHDFKVIYPDGVVSGRLRYKDAMAEIEKFGGSLQFDP